MTTHYLFFERSIQSPYRNASNTSNSVASLALVVAFGTISYNYIQSNRYGTISEVNNSTIYKHHDLMLGFDPSGKISLLGRSAFSDGYYSVSFNNLDTLRSFITNRHDDFSVTFEATGSTGNISRYSMAFVHQENKLTSCHGEENICYFIFSLPT